MPRKKWTDLSIHQSNLIPPSVHPRFPGGSPPERVLRPRPASANPAGAGDGAQPHLPARQHPPPAGLGHARGAPGRGRALAPGVGGPALPSPGPRRCGGWGITSIISSSSSSSSFGSPCSLPPPDRAPLAGHHPGPLPPGGGRFGAFGDWEALPAAGHARGGGGPVRVFMCVCVLCVGIYDPRPARRQHRLILQHLPNHIHTGSAARRSCAGPTSLPRACSAPRSGSCGTPPS